MCSAEGDEDAVRPKKKDRAGQRCDETRQGSDTLGRDGRLKSRIENESTAVRREAD